MYTSNFNSVALKGGISKLQRSSSNIIIIMRCVKGRNSKLQRLRWLTTLCLYRGKWQREVNISVFKILVSL